MGESSLQGEGNSIVCGTVTAINGNGCEICTLSPSIDGHWSHVSICLLTKVINKIKLILDMKFLFLPVGVKCKVVKDVHCPFLLINTGRMPLSP